MFCSPASKCQGLPGGGFLPSLAMALGDGPVLAAGVVGSEHHSLGIGQPVHGERRGILSAIPTLRRGMKFLARPATPFISIGQLRLPRPAIHAEGRGLAPEGLPGPPMRRAVTQYCFKRGHSSLSGFSSG